MKKRAKPRIVIQFAVTAKEKRAIKRAAKLEQMSISEWLLRRAADRIREAHGDDLADMMSIVR